MSADGARSLAVFIDFENLALGFQNRRDRFDIVRVLERLVEKGKVVVKKAYADWSRFSGYTAPLHECAIELIEIPRRALSGKNSADIRLVVDAMDLAYSKEHIDTFCIVSGDSDFSPLVSKLKELGKHVLGLGMQESTSELLRDNCDEFIYYEDLGRTPPSLTPALTAQIPEMKRKAFGLLLESMLALRRENKEVLWSSMIKDTMKRKKPSFNETYHGYRTFSELLEDAQKEGLLELDTDKRSRTYVVTRFGAELTSPAPVGAAKPETVRKRRRPSPTRRRTSPAEGEAGSVAERVRMADERHERMNGPDAHEPEPRQVRVVPREEAEPRQVRVVPREEVETRRQRAAEPREDSEPRRGVRVEPREEAEPRRRVRVEPREEAEPRHARAEPREDSEPSHSRSEPASIPLDEVTFPREDD